MNPIILIWLGAVGLVGSMLFSTLSYALRMMSRVKLDTALAPVTRMESQAPADMSTPSMVNKTGEPLLPWHATVPDKTSL